MATIIDFDEWLECIDLSDFNEVYSLYHTVEELENWGSFSIEVNKNCSTNKYFLSSSECEDTLMLESEEDRTAFLKKIENEHCGDLDMESYYSFHHAMEKDD